MNDKRKALGRGLEQLFNDEGLNFDTIENSIIEEAKTNDQIVEINLSELRANPYQPRKNFDEEALNELASSIKEHGVFQPIIVKKSIKGYEIIAGERRFRASKLAGMQTIPAIVKDFSDEEMMQIALLENLQRENLTSIEEAKAILGDQTAEEYTIPLNILYPKVTTNMIGTEAFPDLLSTYSTNYAASNKNRTTNLILAANKINGTVLMPGETFSYNKVVGARTIAAGYKEAPIYVSGEVVDGVGGGICQITTTLYNAVVYANLEIVQRTNHQFVPSYAPASRDATVVYGSIDFQFKNNRNYPIKIVCSVSGGVANFQIFGLKQENDYDVEISAYVTGRTQTAIYSEAYKILKQDGKVVSSELLSKDTYKRH